MQQPTRLAVLHKAARTLGLGALTFVTGVIDSIRTLLAFVVMVIAFLGGREHLERKSDEKDFPPPGQMVDIGEGRRLHLRCTGTASGPTLVMISGGRLPSVTSYPAQDLMASYARVCSYDRPGLGWSPEYAAQSIGDHAADLDRLITAGKVETPVVLFAESFGGLIALKYIEEHPDKIAAAVFVDAVEPGVWRDSVDELGPPTWIEQRVVDGLAFLGLQRLALPVDVAGYPPQWQEVVRAKTAYRPGALEDSNAAVKTPVERRTPPPPGLMGDKPVLVVRRGLPDPEGGPDGEAAWTVAQARLAALSTRSRVVVAQENGHQVTQEKPALVADAVRAFWADVGRGQ